MVECDERKFMMNEMDYFILHKFNKIDDQEKKMKMFLIQYFNDAK